MVSVRFFLAYFIHTILEGFDPVSGKNLINMLVNCIS